VSGLPAATVSAPEPTALADLVGDRPTLLVFFKASCGTCQIALPVFQHLAPQVRVLGIAQDDRATAASFFEEFGIDIEVAYDAPTFEASTAFDIEAVPAMYLVTDGEVEWSSVGWSLDEASRLAERVGEISGTIPELVGAGGLPPFRPG
jgi:thiol-disulfide isomerase/thioredoxin